MREVNWDGTRLMLPSTKWACKDHSHVIGREGTTTSLDLVIVIVEVQAWTLCIGLLIEEAACWKTVHRFPPFANFVA